MLQGVTGKYGSAEISKKFHKINKTRIASEDAQLCSNQEWFVNSRLRNRAILNEVFCCGG